MHGTEKRAVTRKRAHAIVLLLCLCWYAAAPLAVLALQHDSGGREEIAASRPAAGSCWLPRSSDAQQLAQVPQRESLRLHVVGCAIGAPARCMSAQAHQASADMPHLTSRVHRWCLHLLSRSSPDDPPAA